MNANSEINCKYRFEAAIRRSRVYGFLSTVYRAEVNEAVLNQLRNPEVLSLLAGMGVAFRNDFNLLLSSEHRMIRDLSIEYNRLFIGPGSYISPYESVHRETDNRGWGKVQDACVKEVNTFMQSCKLDYVFEYRGRPDDISIEFEFMQHLLMSEAVAWRNTNSVKAYYYQQREQDFLYMHLFQWVPCFCDKVILAAEHSFYREIVVSNIRL